MAKRRRKIIGTVAQNGAHPPILTPKVVDFGSLSRDPVGDALTKIAAQEAEAAQQKAWAEAFEANAKQGARPLLAFLLSGVRYGPETVFDTAVQIVAGLNAGGYYVLNQPELKALIASAIVQYGAMSEEEKAAYLKGEQIEVNDDGTVTTPEDRAAIEQFNAEKDDDRA